MFYNNILHDKYGWMTLYEVRFSSRVGEELEIIQVHVAVDHWLASLEAVYPGKVDQVEVIDFFGRDEALAHLCFACACLPISTSDALAVIPARG